MVPLALLLSLLCRDARGFDLPEMPDLPRMSWLESGLDAAQAAMEPIVEHPHWEKAATAAREAGQRVAGGATAAAREAATVAEEAGRRAYEGMDRAADKAAAASKKARRLAAKGMDKAGQLAKDTRRLAAEGLDKAQDGLHTAGQATKRAAKAAAQSAATSLLEGASSVVWEAACGSAPCLHGGECVLSARRETQYVCLCTEGYGGDNCERVTVCESSPCLNGGTCTTRWPARQTGPGFACECADGYEGATCLRTPKPEPTPEPEQEPGPGPEPGLSDLHAALHYLLRGSVLLMLLGLGFLATRSKPGDATAATPTRERLKERRRSELLGTVSPQACALRAPLL